MKKNSKDYKLSSHFSPHPSPLLRGEGVGKNIFLPSPSRRRVGDEVKWFTLIELIVSITILSVIFLSVFEIYGNILQVNKRLEIMRIVQENVRSITEQIATDVREKGIDFRYYDGSIAEKTNNYTGSGNQILAIRGGDKYYPMMANGVGVIVQCTTVDQQNPLKHCYVGREDSSGNRKAISDARVRIENVRFFLSGDAGEGVTNQSQEGKVTLVLSLGIENTAGVNSELAKHTHMSIQTTISEKAYKKD